MLFFGMCSLIATAQNSIQNEIQSRLIDLHEVEYNDENFAGFEQIKNEIRDAQIVMLGEQSHTEATTFESKIKLIKYLHQEMDFDILAFESNIYECNKAWSMIEEGYDVKETMGRGIFGIWSVVDELNPLFQYMDFMKDQEKPLMLAGFDPQFMGKLAATHFKEDLTSFLSTFVEVDAYRKDIQKLDAFVSGGRKGMKLKKKKARELIASIQKLKELIEDNKEIDSSGMWIQTLKSFEVFVSDTNLKTNDRDKQMADNLIWLKEKYPEKKIVCWGATSHFLYNSSEIQLENKVLQKLAGDYYHKTVMMGDIIKEKYGDDVYTIGFITHEGTYGYNKSVEIKLPSENSLEYLIGLSDNDNYFLPLNNLPLEGLMSRPLAHHYMKNDISQVMDGVVFNRYNRRPYTDWDFLKQIFPENKVSAKKLERLKLNVELHKQIREKSREKDVLEKA